MTASSTATRSPISRILAGMEGVSFVARTTVNDAAGVARTKRILEARL